MPFHFKHIIFSSKPIHGIEEICESIVIESKFLKIRNSLNHPNRHLPEEIRTLARALVCLKYEPNVVYEVFNPNNNYETLIACNQNVDYIFSATDNKFKKMISSLNYQVNCYEELSSAINSLDWANSISSKNILKKKHSLKYPNNKSFNILVQQIVNSEEGIVREMMLGIVMKYMLYPIVDL